MIPELRLLQQLNLLLQEGLFQLQAIRLSLLQGLSQMIPLTQLQHQTEQRQHQLPSKLLHIQLQEPPHHQQLVMFQQIELEAPHMVSLALEIQISPQMYKLF